MLKRDSIEVIIESQSFQIAQNKNKSEKTKKGLCPKVDTEGLLERHRRVNTTLTRRKLRTLRTRTGPRRCRAPPCRSSQLKP